MQSTSSDAQKYGFVADKVDFPTSASGDMIEMDEHNAIDGGSMSPHLAKLQDGDYMDVADGFDYADAPQNAEARHAACVGFVRTFQSQLDDSLPVDLGTLSNTMGTVQRQKSQQVQAQAVMLDEVKRDKGKDVEKISTDLHDLVKTELIAVKNGVKTFVDWTDRTKLSAVLSVKHDAKNPVLIGASEVVSGILRAYDAVLAIGRQYTLVGGDGEVLKEILYECTLVVLLIAGDFMNMLQSPLTTAIYAMAREMPQDIEHAVVDVQSRSWVPFFGMNSLQLQLCCLTLRLLVDSLGDARTRFERTTLLAKVRHQTQDIEPLTLDALANDGHAMLLSNMSTLIGHMVRMHTAQEQDAPVQKVVVYQSQLLPYIAKVLNLVQAPTIHLLPRFTAVLLYLQGEFQEPTVLSPVARQFLQRFRTKVSFPFITQRWSIAERRRMQCAPHSMLLDHPVSYEMWTSRLTSPCQLVHVLSMYWPSSVSARELVNYTAGLLGGIGDVDETKVTSWKEGCQSEVLLNNTLDFDHVPSVNVKTQQQVQQLPGIAGIQEQVVMTHCSASFHLIPLDCNALFPHLLRHALSIWYRGCAQLFSYTAPLDLQHPSLDMTVFSLLHNCLGQIQNPMSHLLPFLSFSTACNYSSHVLAFFRHAVLFTCQAALTETDRLHNALEQSVCATATASQLGHLTRKLRATAKKGGISALQQAGQNQVGNNPAAPLAKSVAEKITPLHEVVRSSAIVFNALGRLNTLLVHANLLPWDLTELISFDSIAVCSYICNTHHRYMQLRATHAAVQQSLSKRGDLVPGQTALNELVIPTLPELDTLVPTMSIPCIEQAKKQMDQWYNAVLEGSQQQQQAQRPSPLKSTTPITLLNNYVRAQTLQAQHTLTDLFRVAANSAATAFLTSVLHQNTVLLNECIEQGKSSYDIVNQPSLPALLSQDLHVLQHAFEAEWSAHPSVFLSLVQLLLHDLDTLIFESLVHVQLHRTTGIALVKEMHAFATHLSNLLASYVVSYKNVISIHIPDHIITTQNNSVYHFLCTQIGTAGDMIVKNNYNIDKWTIQSDTDSNTLYPYICRKQGVQPLDYELPSAILQIETQALLPSSSWEQTVHDVILSHLPNTMSFVRLVSMSREEQQYIMTLTTRCTEVVDAGMMEKDDLIFLSSKDYVVNENQEINAAYSNTPTPAKVWFQLNHRGILFELDKTAQVLEKCAWVQYEHDEHQEDAPDDDEFAKLFQ